MILVDNVPLTIDVVSWMRQTGRFDRIKATDRDWIEACCPFHDDHRPSFAVHVDTGVYVCQACGAKGNFVKLVQHVEGHDTYFDAEQSLLQRYGRFVPDVDEELTLDFGDREEETLLNAEAIWSSITKYRNVYLNRRGIDNDVQELFEAYYDFRHPSLMLPWRDAKGRMVTIKHRSMKDKRFWYDPPVAPGRLKRLLYGYHLAKDAEMIVVCEGEIDAMSVVQAGFAAVALGGAHLSETQANLMRNAKADEIVVFTDNDEAGRRVRSKIVDALVGHKRVSVVDWSINPALKDANDVLVETGPQGIDYMIEKRINVPLPLKFD